MSAIFILLNIYAKNLEKGTLSTTMCKSLNYNEVPYFPVDNARIIYWKIFHCIPRMLIFYEF
jgi:hypothetical protein